MLSNNSKLAAKVRTTSIVVVLRSTMKVNTGKQKSNPIGT